MNKRFKIVANNEELLITYSSDKIQCFIIVYELKHKGLWQKVADKASVFDIHAYKDETKGNRFFMLLLWGGDKINKTDLPPYKKLMSQAWDFMMYGFLSSKHHYLPCPPVYVAE
jgi:hypothetical protein